MALIEIRDLTFAYQGGEPILRNLSLRIAEGERIAILGGNGAGKSTLAHWLAGLMPRGTHKASSGEVLAMGKTYAEHSAAERTALVQFVGQIPMQQLSGFAFTVYDELLFGPCNLGLPEAEVLARAEAAIEMCNLRHLLERDPFSLSGGEQQRLSIAAALALRPKALVLDEPTGNFDPESRDDLLAQIKDLPKDVAVILCDVALVAALQIADRFLLLHGGEIIADGSAHDILAHPKTSEIFGLPAVAAAAAILQQKRLLTAKTLPKDDAEALALFAPLTAKAAP